MTTNNLDTGPEERFVDRLMAETIRIVTDGNADTARPGQKRLADDIYQVMCSADHLSGDPFAEPTHNQTINNPRPATRDSRPATRDHLVAVAPTGVGKSVAALVPAAAKRYEKEHRTIVATESLALQTQLITKDLPQIGEAYRNLTGETLKFAVYKSIGNYVCGIQAHKEVAETTGLIGDKPEEWDRTPEEWDRTLKNVPEYLRWAVTSFNNQKPTDKAAVPVQVTGKEWATISTDSNSCLADKCPYYHKCGGIAARKAAGSADILVTNHAMLAVQTALAATIVLGTTKLGDFQHLIIDECHGFASSVRDQGAIELSGVALSRMTKKMGKVFYETDPSLVTLSKQAEKLGKKLGKELKKVVVDKFGLGIIGPGINPLPNQLYSELIDLTTEAEKMLKTVEKKADTNPTLYQSWKSAEETVNKISAGLELCFEAEPGYARWVEDGWTGDKTFQASPVNVAKAIRRNLFGITNPAVARFDEVTVTMMSATIQEGFVGETGVTVDGVREYESPFEEAYQNSCLYVAEAVTDQDQKMLSDRYNKFSTYQHPDWATPKIVELIKTNQGSALVLSATTKAGKQYADALREQLPDISIISQWDGYSNPVNEWKNQANSVLVGTRSMMTGVDAPGQTCTLVIIDRVPRAPMNPIDEARTEVLIKDPDNPATNIWVGREAVYGGDAALLLEQAAGRLIRSVTDKGMVAVLDPRLLKRPTDRFRMSAGARKKYKRALKRFNRIVTNLDDASDYLRNNQTKTK